MKMRALAAMAAAGLLALSAAPVITHSAWAEPAAIPDKALSDPAQEARARALFADIRCVVCQHESIADSPASIAADLRRLVREQIAAGKTDEEIRADLVRRYGDYVLFTPPFRAGTLLLWLGPVALVVLVGGFLLVRSRRAGRAAEALTPEEEAALAEWIAAVDKGASPAHSDDKDI